jgi:hypothetical protein
MKKFALYAFNGELMCFVHVLLNALDMLEKGYDVKIVIEGSATKLIAPLADPGTQFASLYAECRKKGLIDCICRACAHKMGTLQEAERQELPLCSDMSGHPSMSSYIEAGFSIITF